MEVATWNIQKGIGMDFRRDLARTTCVLQRTGADVIALQEVRRTSKADQAASLARALDMELVWGPAREGFGNALLVRGEVRAHRVHDLSVPRCERRACLEASVVVREQAARFFVCHFGLGFYERSRQVERLAAILRAAPADAPRIVLGDFNEWYRGPVHRLLHAEFPGAPERKPTHPSFLPIFALDRVAWDAPLQGAIRVDDSGRASDHRLVRATLAAPSA